MLGTRQLTCCPLPTQPAARRLMLGLNPEADTPTGPSSAPAPAPTSAPASAPATARGERGGGGSGAVSSRLLEHTASSLARCAATLQHVPAAQPGHGSSGGGAPASGSAPLTARAFGSPLPPAGRSRTSSLGVERDATPVGAEGPTPDAAAAAAAPELRLRSGSGGPLSPSASGGRSRTLQLADLHRDLSALQEQGAVTLGLNPTAPGSRPTPPTAPGAAAAQPQRSTSPPREQPRGVGKPGSPFRRTLALGGWGHADGATPPADGAEQRLSSPGRLARLLGRGGAGQGSGGKAAAQAAAGEATYDLQQSEQQPPAAAAAGHRSDSKAAVGGPLAAHPLRCSNGHSSTTSEASGSRAGSPRDPDFRIGAASACGGAPENRSRPASSAASPTKLPAGARPRSAGSGAAGSGAAAAVPGAVRTLTSPRRAPAWKPGG